MRNRAISIRNPSHLHFFFICFLFPLLFFGTVHGEESSLCATVKIEIRQELTLERQAFDAHMRIINGLTHMGLEDVDIDVVFTDEQASPVLVTSDPNASEAKFFIRLDSMDNIADVDGTGRIEPSGTADIHWLIVPAPGASDGIPTGKLYYVGATLTYTLGGEAHVTRVTPDYIYVKPMPELVLDYFLPAEVFGDDAFTEEIEPPIPFCLGVRVTNTGHGAARSLKIDSAQPKIVENQQGLLIGFAITGSEVDGHPAANSLLVDLGDIDPQTSKAARWTMTCSLSGRFSEFTASFSHSNELGGELTSLMEGMGTHLLVRDVLVDVAGRDGVRDFLAKDGDFLKVYETDGPDGAVLDRSGASSVTLQSESGSQETYSLTMPVTAGFAFVKIPDPGQGQMALASVSRSDGKSIKTANAWLSRERKSNPADGWNHFFNLFDANTTDRYILFYESVTVMPQPPVLAFIPDRTVIEENQVSFIVEATDPNGTTPSLSVQRLPAGAVFTDLGAGAGRFDWTPAAGQAGSYRVTFSAWDGALSASRSAAITVFSIGDTDGDGMLDTWELAHFGTLDRNGTGDFDGDGISDYEEFRLGSNPAGEDHVPSVPAILSPQNGAFVPTVRPVLTIENSTDADGDPLTYQFELFADERLTVLMDGQSNVAETSGQTAWEVTADLTENHPYFFRVRASDGYSRSLWAYGTFTVNIQNEPPLSPRIDFPKDGTRIDTPSPVFSILNAGDPDGDALEYRFEVYEDSGLSAIIAASPSVPQEAGATTSWPSDTELDDGVVYFWRVSALDPSGARTDSGTGSFLVDLTNHAPPQPTILFPEPASEVSVLEVTLSAGGAADPDGDPVWYEFELDTVRTFNGPSKIVSQPIPQDGDAASLPLPPLPDNTTYFWRVRAGDGAALSPWEEGDFFVNLANNGPAVPVIKNPGQESWVASLKPTLSVSFTPDPDLDDVLYEYEISADELISSPIASGVSDRLDWQPEFPLDPGRWYYFHVRAVDEHGFAGGWSSVYSFYICSACIDRTPPSASAQPAGGTFEAPQTVSLSADEPARIYYTRDGSEPTFASLEYLSPITIDADAVLKFIAMDAAGNQSMVFTETYTIRPPGIDVHVMTDKNRLLANVKVYAFTASGAYTGRSKTTGSEGTARFEPTDLADGSYKFRVDYLGRQFWAGPVGVPGAWSVSVVIAEETVVVTAMTSAGPQAGVRVYLFSGDGAYLGLSAVTDENGRVRFDLPVGFAFAFRADILGGQYWASATITGGAINPVAVDAGGGLLQITLAKGADEPMAGIQVYLFNAAGAYLGRSRTTDELGRAAFDVPDGTYKVRADYLGYPFWSDPTPVNLDTNIDLTIAHQAVLVRVDGHYQGVADPMENVDVYLFTPSGAHLGRRLVTDAEGRATFSLPQKEYKFRIDYLGRQYWSDTAAWQDPTIDIPMADVEITVTGGGFPRAGVRVYGFSPSNAYLGINTVTDTGGRAMFRLPEASYKFRVDYQGSQYWSETVALTAGLVNPVAVSAGGGTFVLTVGKDGAEPLAGLKCYVFDDGGRYLGLWGATDSQGEAAFDLADGTFVFRVDYMGYPFFSDPVTVPARMSASLDIEHESAVAAVTAASQPAAGVRVYLFDANNGYLGIFKATDAGGRAFFDLPVGRAYRFRADILDQSYWSTVVSITAGSPNPIAVDAGGGRLEVTVQRGPAGTMAGIKTYLYDAEGRYLGRSRTSDATGQAGYDVPAGVYKVRADYLGYWFWTEPAVISTDTDMELPIAHQVVEVTVQGKFQGVPTPIENASMYLYSPTDAYLGVSRVTGVDGKAVFDLPGKPYKVRVDFLGRQYWSDPFESHVAIVEIPMADAALTVTGAGFPKAGVRVYVFTPSGTYLGLSAETDSLGRVQLHLPAGDYKFRVDYQGSQFFSQAQALAPDQGNAVILSVGGGSFTLAVSSNGVDPLSGLRCYVFNEPGNYLGLSGATDHQGQASFDLADGTCKIRVDYLGYSFWTSPVSVPQNLSAALSLAHTDSVITIQGAYPATEPLAGVRVYLFNPAGSYLGQSRTTDAAGQVVFHLPDRDYKVRADYLGNQFWSDVFRFSNQIITIDRGQADIHVTRAGQNVAGAKVYLFSATGAYLGQNATTDAEGKASFVLPNRTYKLRADEGAAQVWTPAIDIVAGQDNPVSISLDQ
jgi:hypothetical protein